VRENTAIPKVFNVFEPCLRRELIKIFAGDLPALPARGKFPLAEKSPEISENSEHYPRVLIVDDHVVTLELIRISLQKAALCFDEARNAEEVLHAVAHADYQLILMDINLPGTDGLQLTRKLRAQGFSAPVCALTAHDFSVIGEQCLQAGMQDLLRKPFRQTELFTLLEKYLGQPGQPDGTKSWCAGGK
jgi:CheY-like chemotaxis protein